MSRMLVDKDAGWFRVFVDNWLCGPGAGRTAAAATDERRRVCAGVEDRRGWSKAKYDMEVVVGCIEEHRGGLAMDGGTAATG